MWYSPPEGVVTEKGRPPCSSETATSSSVIAEAIQMASRWDASPVSAVTSPPPPRVMPCGVCSTGPRLETSTNGASDSLMAFRLLPSRLQEDAHPVSQQPGHEEVRADVLLPLA